MSGSRVWFGALSALALAVGAVATGVATAATAATVFVSPSGDDSAAGTATAPVRSLAHARDLARAQGSGTTVQLADGTYRLTSPLTLAPFDRMRPMTVRNDTLFPDPDSPTTPSVSPEAIEKEMPSTAFTTPSSVRNWTRRSFTSSSGSGNNSPHVRHETSPGARMRPPGDQAYLTRASRKASSLPARTGPSRVPDPGIQVRVEDVHHQVHHRDEERGEHCDVHDRVDVPAAHGPHHQVPQAL